jgi:hypothetical protein
MAPLILHYYRRLALLALCTMLIGSAAPTLSRVLAASNNVVWVEVCSSNGSHQRMAIGVEISDEGNSSPLLSLDQCGYCTLLHYSPVMPTPNLAWQTPAVPSTILTAQDTVPTTPKASVRNAHRTRAPPYIS